MRPIGLIWFMVSVFAMGCACDLGPKLSPAAQKRLETIEAEMLVGYTDAVELDRRINDAVRQMVATLRPEYRSHCLRKYRLGFLEVSDVDRRTITRLHNYITEKALTFSFLKIPIAENFNIVERFLLDTVIKELKLDMPQYSDNPGKMEQAIARRLGELYGIDIIETGTVTDSDEYIDINLRMIETQWGQIVAVGSAKVKSSELTEEWLDKRGYLKERWFKGNRKY